MYRLAIAVAVVCALCSFSLVQAETFSITPGSEAPFQPNDILSPGPVVHLSSGLFGDDINALSAGKDKGTIIYFSIEDSAEILVSSNQQGTFMPPMGFNTLLIEPINFGLGQNDDIDAFNFTEFDLGDGTIIGPGDGIPDINVYLSLAAGSPSLGVFGVSAADILLTGPIGVGVIEGATMGLQSGDDLDALAMLDLGVAGIIDTPSDSALFSLAAGSPTLADMGLSAADVLFTTFDGTLSVYATAESLGLDPSADLNALEVQPGVPEPISMTLLGIGLVGLAIRRRRG